MTAFLTPSLEPEDALVAAPWRPHFLNEYKSVGTYFNDHSSSWGNDRGCPGKMPRGPDSQSYDTLAAGVAGPVVIEGPSHTLFLHGGGGDELGPGCPEATGVGNGTCYFVDSTHSNNWRQLRIVGGDDGVDMNYIEYDPNWLFNDTAAMQHYELYDVSQDKYQVHNIYAEQTEAKKAELHKMLDEYWHCGSPTIGSIGSGNVMPAGKSNCP
jgi:N-acetylglucosamine-6-sulfatase